MNRFNTFIAYHPFDTTFFLLLMLATWFAIVSGFGYDMIQLSKHGHLHFPAIIHIHAAAFVGWLILFTVQLLLVRSKNIALHRNLGFISCGLIPVMVILGIIASFISQKIHYGTPDGDPRFLSVQLGDSLMFGCLAGAGIYLRKNYVAHKRLMLLSTLVLTGAGFARWFCLKIAPLFGSLFWNYKTFSDGFGKFWIFVVFPPFFLILSLGIYDLVTRKNLSKAYLWGAAFFVTVTTTEGFLYYNDAWYTLMKYIVGGGINSHPTH